MLFVPTGLPSLVFGTYPSVTEFLVPSQKLYLLPIMDLYNGEILNYNLSERTDFHQTMAMVTKAIEILPDKTGLIIHSDQDWQYQIMQQ